MIESETVFVVNLVLVFQIKGFNKKLVLFINTL